MFKQLSTLLFLAFLVFAGCETTQKATPANPDESDATPMTATPATPQNVGVPMKGDHYETTILNDSIKSPRKELKGTIEDVQITINYGSPSVNGRKLYGDLVPYGKVWRTGANEAVRITTSAPLRFGGDSGKVVPAGTYGLFTLPADKDNWTIIFNKVADQWGAYDYAENMDVARVTTTSVATENFSEQMDFSLTGNSLQLHWGELIIPVTVQKPAK